MGADAPHPTDPGLRPAGQSAGWVAGLVLVVATLAAYAGSFHAPFVFDDVSSIVDNPTIRRLWPPWEALSPPRGWGFTVSGRPVLNLSFALNYAVSGFDVWSYHALNLAIHILAGLALFGLLRRTLARPPLAERFSSRAVPLAAVITGVWLLHPLQTESVTYVVQRAESLMGLFFLLTIYAFSRSAGSARAPQWWAVSYSACLLGVGTKEVAAVAPIMVLLYDRTFVSGTFREAWRRHGWGHLALASTWLPLAWLVWGTGGNRGGTVGFDVGVSAFGYWLTQFEAVTRYLALTFWPHPLVFDYGKVSPPGLVAVIPLAVLVLGLVAAAAVALKRRPVAGFLGAWFFGILAPTSVVPGAIQMIVEHRMYLPLAAVIALVFGMAARWFEARGLLAIGAALAIACGVATVRRNFDYAGELRLWEDTVAKRPGNARAHSNLGPLLYRAGRHDEAMAHFKESLRLDPGSAHTHYNFGLAMMQAGRVEEAVAAFNEAVGILPYYVDAHLNLGTLLTGLGRPDEAIGHFEQALRYSPSPAEAHFRLGVALADLGRLPEAVANYAKALEIDPGRAEAQSNWGVALFRMGGASEAVVHFQEALRLKPEMPDVHYNLALALGSMGRVREAIPHYAEAVRLSPDHLEARLNLSIALGQVGDLAASIEHLREMVRLHPDFYPAHANLGFALAEAGRPDEALAAYESALRLRPADAQAYYSVGYALVACGRVDEAPAFLEEALRLQPGFTAARELLHRLRQNPVPPR